MVVTKTSGGATLIAALLVALSLAVGPVPGAAGAQEPGPRTLELTPSNGSGVGGTARLAETGRGVEVRLDIEGLPESGVEHLAHIHEGATCADDRAGNGAPVEFPLESVVAEGGAGSSTSTTDATFDELLDGEEPYYINVHAEQTEPETVPPGVACANILSTSASASADASGTLADTGGVSPLAVLLAAGAILASLGAATGYLLRRPAA